MLLLGEFNCSPNSCLKYRFTFKLAWFSLGGLHVYQIVVATLIADENKYMYTKGHTNLHIRAVL